MCQEAFDPALIALQQGPHAGPERSQLLLSVQSTQTVNVALCHPSDSSISLE
jgi:hypothetical protein